MDSVFSNAAAGSGPADRTPVHALIYCAGLRPAIRDPVLQHYPSTLQGIDNQGVSWEARINLNRVSLHAVPTVYRGTLSSGCAGTVEQPGGTCAPCLDIKGHECLQGFVPKRGACLPLVAADYIDHLALTEGFTYLNNLKYSLTFLVFAMLACLTSLFVNSRVCSTPSTGAQPRNGPPSKKTE